MISIYNKNLKHKETLNYNIDNFLPEWYPDWEEGDIVSSEFIQYPKIDKNTNEIREKTREERILEDNAIELLLNGEKIEKGKILTIKKPESRYLSYIWDREKYTWEVVTKKEELMFIRKDLILKRKHLKIEVEELQEEADEFEVGDTIALLEKEIEELKQEIIVLSQEIKKLK